MQVLKQNSQRNPSPRRRFSRTSLLRLIPSLIVVFLPFGALDEAFLKSLYTLRGQLNAPSDVEVIHYTRLSQVDDLLRLMPVSSVRNCVVLEFKEGSATKKCLHATLEEFYSVDLNLDHYKKLTQYFHSREWTLPYRILFYGNLNSFQASPIEKYLENKNPEHWLNAKTLIFSPKDFPDIVKLPSPVGPLAATEFAYNVITNALHKESLFSLAKINQILYSLTLLALTIWIVYSYPTFLTLLFLIGSTGLQMVAATLFLQHFHLLLPLGAPVVTVLVVYVLGMSDRLDRRERREWRLEQEATALVQVDEMRNNFLSLVSHDLKTPLARMRSVLERFFRGDFGPLSQDQSEHLKKIIDANGALQRSISTLLLLSRIESREIEIKLEPVDLATLLESVVKSFQPAAIERQIRFILEIEPMFLVDLDQALIKEVAINVIDNALKYSPASTKITVRCGEQENGIELMPPRPALWFEVQDEGPGIPIEERKKVFHKFTRGKTEPTALDQSVKGTGLGLFLAHYFVQQHNGAISLYSKIAGEEIHASDPASQYFGTSGPSSGTLFRIVIPIDQV